MNIFVLDLDIDTCAKYHVDKHVVKMPLEAAQMLSTTVWIDQVLGFIPRKLDKHEREELRRTVEPYRNMPIPERPIGYLPAMVNHPCTIWARTSGENFLWLFCYANALNDEYGYRYGGKSHKSLDVINNTALPKNIEMGELTPFAQAMPDQYKSDDTVEAYRNYYIGEKSGFAKWSHREIPEWWN